MLSNWYTRAKEEEDAVARCELWWSCKSCRLRRRWQFTMSFDETGDQREGGDGFLWASTSWSGRSYGRIGRAGFIMGAGELNKQWAARASVRYLLFLLLRCSQFRLVRTSTSLDQNTGPGRYLKPWLVVQSTWVSDVVETIVMTWVSILVNGKKL